MALKSITLCTDFGLGSTYVAQMHQVLTAAVPGARIEDLTHQISPQSVLEAQLFLRAQALGYPPGTVHVVVVDPGVGSARRPIALCVGGIYFVGPDNGVFHPFADIPNARTVVLDRPHFFRQPVSRTFHGRDIFAPVAAELYSGLLLEDVGCATNTIVEGPLKSPVQVAGGFQVPLLAKDTFGNVLTHLKRNVGCQVTGVTLEGREIEFVSNYDSAPENTLVALFGSDGYLELAVKNDSAARLLQNQFLGRCLTVSVS